MKALDIDFTYVRNFVSDDEISQIKEKALLAQEILLEKKGAGNDYLGWLDLPSTITDSEIKKILSYSEKIKNSSDVLVVIGIGGSYLGAKAALDFLNGYFLKPKTEIIFAGHNLSSEYMDNLLNYLEDKDFSLNVISKSGSTTEPAIAFRLLKDLLVKKYQNKANERIYATTDPVSGNLRSQGQMNGYHLLDIPSDIGGRYSVLTAVGLLPLAVAGIDIRRLLEGAKDSEHEFKHQGWDNLALQYAALRNVFYQKKRFVEAFVVYEPKFRFLGEWLKQLFAESEGKEEVGIFPTSLVYSTDLHSVGQFVQEGTKILFETTLLIKQSNYKVLVKSESDNSDNLNYLSGKSLDYINHKIYEAVNVAHEKGNVPNILISLEKNDSYHLGYLFYFFMISCSYSGYILGINPFNQEGVEQYKKEMFKLLGKPGF